MGAILQAVEELHVRYAREHPEFSMYSKLVQASKEVVASRVKELVDEDPGSFKEAKPLKDLGDPVIDQELQKVQELQQISSQYHKDLAKVLENGFREVLQNIELIEVALENSSKADKVLLRLVDVAEIDYLTFHVTLFNGEEKVPFNNPLVLPTPNFLVPDEEGDIIRLVPVFKRSQGADLFDPLELAEARFREDPEEALKIWVRNFFKG